MKSTSTSVYINHIERIPLGSIERVLFKYIIPKDQAGDLNDRSSMRKGLEFKAGSWLATATV